MTKDKKKDTCNVVCFKDELVTKIKGMMPSDKSIRDVADTFSILGDKTRVKIVFALSKETELCVCDIANILGLTISATSHQLRKLRDKGVVKFENDGNMVYYSLDDRYIEELLNDAFKQVEVEL
ncbi:MAG: metalloregulator ArsR/SmtB family transcription factor [bacterium]